VKGGAIEKVVRAPSLSGRVVLFDLDGTLVDSSHAHEEAFLWTLRGASPELARSFEYRRYRGQTTAHVLRSLGLEDPALVVAKQQHYRDALTRGAVTAFHGAHEILAMLKRQGRRLAVVTGGSRRSTEAVLAATGLATHFETVVSGDDVARGKPSPDGYLAGLSFFCSGPGDAFAVEDAASGIASAKAAGLVVVGVGPDGLTCGADHHVASLGALSTLLSDASEEGRLSG